MTQPDLSYIHPDLRALALPLDSLTPDPRNARKHSRRNLEAIKASLVRSGVRQPIVVQRGPAGLVIRAGNGRTEVARELGWTHLPAIVVDEGDEAAVAYALEDNRTAELAEWDPEVLGAHLAELGASGIYLDAWDQDELAELVGALETPQAMVPGVQPDQGAGEAEDPSPGEPDTRRPGQLARDFGAPPFSVLDTRQGYWQERKKAWLALGIQSELGRGEGLAYNTTGMIQDPKFQMGPRPRAGASADTRPARDFGSPYKGGDVWAGPTRRDADLRSNLTGAPDLPGWADNGTARMAPGTSIFDPVLTELLVRWFTPPGGRVLDPFAGGSVRGVVTAKLGRSYVGLELRPEQVEANRQQALDLGTPGATWVQGDSRVTLDGLEGGFDAILSCPPYYDLEVYSDRGEDLSAMGTYQDFLAGYRDIIAKAVDRLAPDSFACWVVGDLRGPDGCYRNFVGDTVQAFLDAGMSLYNEAILVNPVGTLALRAPKQFRAGRKLGKTHQNVLVFYKGDTRNIRGRLGDIEVPGDVDDAYVGEMTPIQQVGGNWVKRDDLYTVAGVPGGKARTCWHLAQGAVGLVTAGSRQSPR